MTLPLLFAAALAQASLTGASPPSDAVSPSPPASAQTASPSAASPLAASSASPPSAAGAADESDIPKGAPSDDYGLVAWCRGALTGHMALYPLVKPELKSIERPNEVASDERDDQLQMQAGRDYLALYRRAMLTAEKAHPTLHERGVTVTAQGEAIWTAVKVAPARTRMWSWLMWDLPGRCETAAKRLQVRSGLLGAAFKDGDAEASTPAAPALRPRQ